MVTRKLDHATQLTRLLKLDTNPTKRAKLLAALTTIVMKHLDIDQTLSPQKHKLAAVKKEIQHRFPLLFRQVGNCPDGEALEHAMGYVSVRFMWLRSVHLRQKKKVHESKKTPTERARAPSPPQSVATSSDICGTSSGQRSEPSSQDSQELEDCTALSQKTAVEPPCQSFNSAPRDTKFPRRTTFPRGSNTIRACPSPRLPEDCRLVPTSGSCLRACCSNKTPLDKTFHSEVITFLSSSRVQSLVRFADVFVALGCSTMENLQEVSTWTEEQFDYFLSTANSLLPVCEPCTAFERMALWALFENSFENVT